MMPSRPRLRQTWVAKKLGLKKTAGADAIYKRLAELVEAEKSEPPRQLLPLGPERLLQAPAHIGGQTAAVLSEPPLDQAPLSDEMRALRVGTTDTLGLAADPGQGDGT